LCSFGSKYTFLVVQSNSLVKSQIILLIVYEWDDQTKEGMGKTQRKKKPNGKPMSSHQMIILKIDHNLLGLEELEDVQWHDFENTVLSFWVS